MKVTEDLLKGGSASDSAAGYIEIRFFLVDEIVGDAPARRFIALQSPDIPQRGQEHPAISGIFCKSRSCIMKDLDKAEVVCTYEVLRWDEKEADETAAPEWEVGTTVQSVETMFDANGDQIIVSFTKPAGTDPGQTEAIVLPDQVGTIRKQVPMTYARLSRLEPNNPQAKSRFYTGTTNSTPFLGDAARSWLCMGITARELNTGFAVNYSFQLAELKANLAGTLVRTWDTIVAYTDGSTGEPAAGVTAGNGLIEVEVPVERDFTPLNLGVP